jgi:nucleotide-binding universal stress UspA family protein
MTASDFVLDLAHVANSKVTVLHAFEKGTLKESGVPMGTYISPNEMEEARARRDDLTMEGSHRKVSVETVSVEGVASEAILKTADATCANLIVVMPKHKGLLERALLGSTAERVIKEAQVPVLSVPAGARASIKQLGERSAA